jgi:hypothetical protein
MISNTLLIVYIHQTHIVKYNINVLPCKRGHFRDLAESKEEHICIYPRSVNKMAVDLHVSVLFVLHPVGLQASDMEGQKGLVVWFQQ